MNPKHLPSSSTNHARCPVCHQAVYSKAGIHPQCAVRQSEPPRVKDKPPVPAEPAVDGLDEPAASAVAAPVAPTRLAPAGRTSSRPARPAASSAS